MAKKKRKLTPIEQHKRFVAMAKEVEADESPNALDKAFKKLSMKNSIPDRKANGRKP